MFETKLVARSLDGHRVVFNGGHYLTQVSGPSTAQRFKLGDGLIEISAGPPDFAHGTLELAKGAFDNRHEFKATSGRLLLAEGSKGSFYDGQVFAAWIGSHGSAYCSAGGTMTWALSWFPLIAFEDSLEGPAFLNYPPDLVPVEGSDVLCEFLELGLVTSESRTMTTRQKPPNAGTPVRGGEAYVDHLLLQGSVDSEAVQPENMTQHDAYEALIFGESAVSACQLPLNVPEEWVVNALRESSISWTS